MYILYDAHARIYDTGMYYQTFSTHNSELTVICTCYSVTIGNLGMGKLVMFNFFLDSIVVEVYIFVTDKNI